VYLYHLRTVYCGSTNPLSGSVSGPMQESLRGDQVPTSPARTPSVLKLSSSMLQAHAVQVHLATSGELWRTLIRFGDTPAHAFAQVRLQQHLLDSKVGVFSPWHWRARPISNVNRSTHRTHQPDNTQPEPRKSPSEHFDPFYPQPARAWNVAVPH
jgi:hypothetical protein